MNAARALTAVLLSALLLSLGACCGHTGAVRDAQARFNELVSLERTASKPRLVHDSYRDVEADLVAVRGECGDEMRAEGLLGTAETLRVRARARRGYWGHVAAIESEAPDELLAPGDVNAEADALRGGDLADQIHDRDRVLLRLVPATAPFESSALTMARHRADGTWDAARGEPILAGMLVSDVDIEGLITEESAAVERYQKLEEHLIRWRWRILATVREQVLALGLWSRPSSSGLVSDLNSRMAALTTAMAEVLPIEEAAQVLRELRPVGSEG